MYVHCIISDKSKSSTLTYISLNVGRFISFHFVLEMSFGIDLQLNKLSGMLSLMSFDIPIPVGPISVYTSITVSSVDEVVVVVVVVSVDEFSLLVHATSDTAIKMLNVIVTIFLISFDCGI